MGEHLASNLKEIVNASISSYYYDSVKIIQYFFKNLYNVTCQLHLNDSGKIWNNKKIFIWESTAYSLRTLGDASEGKKPELPQGLS